MSVVKIKSEGLRLGGRRKVTAVRVLSVLRKGDGAARGLVAEGTMAPDWDRDYILTQNKSGQQKLIVHSRRSSLVIKNRACNLFYIEGLRT